jgi:hypothetical protein
VASVTVTVELEDAHYRSLVVEAARRGVSVENLVQKITQWLIRELEDSERSGTDLPISTA